jgi:hypothetical protein
MMSVLLTLALVAAQSGQQPRRFGPGECGPVDPVYIHTANETGGQPFFLNPSEIAKAFHVVRESSWSDQATLLWAMGTVDAGRVHEFNVPIDSSIRRVTFSLSVDTKGGDLTVFNPAGTVLVARDNLTEITDLNCGRVVTVDLPPAGTWRLRVTGVGRFWLVTHGRSDIDFISAEFVRVGGRPGHEGLFRIPGQPLAGMPAMLRAHVSQEHASSTSFELVSQHGDTIQLVDTAPQNAEAAGDELTATLRLPSEPFRVAVKGVDMVGLPYQRVFRALFHAETVEVTPAATIEDLPRGSTTPVTFNVRNVGPANTFRILAVDPRRFVSRFEPRALALESGAVGTVTVWMKVPPEAGPESDGTLIVTAESQSGPRTTNSALLHFSVR